MVTRSRAILDCDVINIMESLNQENSLEMLSKAIPLLCFKAHSPQTKANEKAKKDGRTSNRYQRKKIQA